MRDDYIIHLVFKKKKSREMNNEYLQITGTVYSAAKIIINDW